MRAVVGLGNPGPEYELTRHNAGFMVADAVATRWDLPRFKRPWRWRARVTRGVVSSEPVVVVKPQTYMNRSGTALSPLLRERGFEPARDLLVMVDEVALPLGSFRIRPRGSHGGHRGLMSVAGRLASEEYARLRVGVGPRPGDESNSDFLLDEFAPEQLDRLSALIPTLTEAVECWVIDGIDTAMNRFNKRGAQSE